MYTEIGSFDAKTRFSRLLQEVQQGRRFTITLRGRPVANLVPNDDLNDATIHDAVHAMRNLPNVQGVEPEEVAAWIAEGRR